MNSSCLTGDALRGLVAGSLPAAGEAEALRHLNECAACRERLEQSTGDTRAIPGWPDKWNAAPSCPALAEVVDALRDSVEAESGESLADIIGLLRVSDVEGSLGRFAGYEIEQVVDSGGMGIVLKARDLRLDRIVALKLLAPRLAVSDRARQRFLREGRAVAAIEHDHVVAIHGADEANGLPYLVMEYVPGESLAKRLAREGPLPAGEAVSLGRQIAAGLAAAHTRGIIHRDIKPANILLHEDGTAKLTDFGLARAADEPGQTRHGFIAGTPEYFSPEQAAGQLADERSDLFGLGAVFYAMGTGQSPFHADSTLAAMRMVCDVEPPPLSDVVPDFPRWLSDVVARLLAKKPEERIQTASELMAILESPEATLSARRARVRRRTAWAWATAAAGVAGSILVFNWPRESATREPVPQHELFVLLNENGERAGGGAELSTIVANAPAESIIELRWSGPQKIAPVKLPGHSLTLRAGSGFQPAWIHHPGSGPALSATAALAIENLTFFVDGAGDAPGAKPRGNPDESEAAAAAHIPPDTSCAVHCAGANLRVSNCRFENLSAGNPSASVILEDAPSGRIENCSFFAMPGKAVVWRTRPGGNADSRLRLDNCVSFALESVWIDIAEGTRGQLELARTTFRGRAALLFASAPGESAVMVLSSHTLFHSATVIADRRPAGSGPLGKAATWTDDYTLLGVTRNLVSDESNMRQEIFLSKWNALWGGETGKVWVGRGRFARGRAAPRSTEAAAVSIDEFRLGRLIIDQGGEAPENHLSQFGADLSKIGPQPAEAVTAASSSSSPGAEK